ncbi:hypothetical protein HZA40_00420, partial [Candidatus Peregrinibacteria bacterium]|nr:hypothetical protein [Candidatus Peregrinibacteria bacterium]
MVAKKKKKAADQTEEIAPKKVIYAEIDDEVTALFDKLKQTNSKSVYIVVPKRAIIFQSVVNLKILKRKAEDSGKEIFLITNDKNGIHLAQKTGIEVYDKTNPEGKSAFFASEGDDEKLRITPLKASINAVEEEVPTRMAEKKLSIGEILKNAKGKKAIDISKIKNAEKKQEPQKAKPKFVIVAPNRQALIALVSVTLIILLVIIYVALPGVTIYLTPTASVLEKSVNITLADAEKNRAELETHPSHEIASYPISTRVNKTIVQYSTGKKFSDKGANASGNLTIYNTVNASHGLVEQTRFQTKDGIVFRITDDVTVPAADSKGPGKLDVYVVADQTDANGSIVGQRGNIGPSRFFLPGLKGDAQNKIYALSTTDMKGGVTDYVTFVTQQDIDAAKSRIKSELTKVAIDELKKSIKDKAVLNGQNANFELLQGDNKAINTGEIALELDQALLNKQVPEFQITGSMDVGGIYYDHDAMLEIMKDELLLKKSPQKELLRVNEGSTTYKIFQRDEPGGKIKITANIKGVEQFQIDPDKENGAQLLEKIREHIAGLDIKEATNYIQNLPEINKVEISSWPAWSP